MTFWSATTHVIVDPATPLPILHYLPPTNFYRAHGPGPDHYSSFDGGASLHIYPFRHFRGDIAKAFRETRLSDWIEPQDRECNVVGQPMFGRDSITGARAVLTVRFIEAVARLPREHVRFVVIVGHSAALIDVSAETADALQQVTGDLKATFSSMRVEDATG